MTWREAVIYFKRKEDPQLLLLLRGEPTMQRLLSAWSSVATGFEHTRSGFDKEASMGEAPINSPDAALWVWIWAERFYGEPPWEEWGRAAKVNSERHRDEMIRAVVLRMIYPDGTVHSTCLAYLHKLAAKELKR